MSEHEHGTITSYVRGCRCDICTTAWRDYYREYRDRPGKREAAVAAQQRYRAKAASRAPKREATSPQTETD